MKLPADIERELQVLETWIEPRQTAGVPRLRALRAAIEENERQWQERYDIQVYKDAIFRPR